MPKTLLRLDAFTEALAGLSEYSKQTESNAEYQEWLTVLRRIVEGELTHKQKQCVTLYYYENKSLTEIAEMLRINISTVSRHLQKARNRIEKIMCYYFPKLH